METPTLSLSLTEAAARRVKTLQDRKGKPNLLLRVTVDGGGCAGFQYKFSFDEAMQPDDHAFTEHGITVVSDTVSLELLNGGVIDFAESLVGAAFQIRNPNAASSCGCGTSFSV